MSLEYDEQLKEQALDEFIVGFCPNVDDPYSLPKIRCECGYVGPAHMQAAMTKELYCKHCKQWHDKAEGSEIPGNEWRLPE